MQSVTSRRLKRKSTTYHAILAPWAVVRWLSPTDRAVVGRFRTRSDADGHAVALRRLIPKAYFDVLFEINSHFMKPPNN
ncbi:MAG: hypothetical protein VKL59_22225 [Nostocaceae cyanobacterium]|nr:hypothetical protein [Nostocaceae cyanobacterium]